MCWLCSLRIKLHLCEGCNKKILEFINLIFFFPPSGAECSTWEHLPKPSSKVLLWRESSRAPTCMNVSLGFRTYGNNSGPIKCHCLEKTLTNCCLGQFCIIVAKRLRHPRPTSKWTNAVCDLIIYTS